MQRPELALVNQSRPSTGFSLRIEAIRATGMKSSDYDTRRPHRGRWRCSKQTWKWTTRPPDAVERMLYTVPADGTRLTRTDQPFQSKLLRSRRTAWWYICPERQSSRMRWCNGGSSSALTFASQAALSSATS